jgi:hypothetical protein
MLAVTSFQISSRLQLAKNLATAIASRLMTVVPPDVEVRSRESLVEFEMRGSGWRAASSLGPLIDQEGDLRAHIEAAAWNALDVAQDYICEVTRNPWPAVMTNSPPTRYAQPLAQIRDDVLYLGYGWPELTVLSLSSIPLFELRK